jgi:hypothetical protein
MEDLLLTIRFSRTQFNYLGHQHTLVASHHPRLDEILHSHRSSSSLRCIFVGTFKIALKLSLQWHLMAKMFAQGTAVASDGSLISKRSPETTECEEGCA